MYVVMRENEIAQLKSKLLKYVNKIAGSTSAVILEVCTPFFRIFFYLVFERFYKNEVFVTSIKRPNQMIKEPILAELYNNNGVNYERHLNKDVNLP
jgi:hypothetical protein